MTTDDYLGKLVEFQCGCKGIVLSEDIVFQTYNCSSDEYEPIITDINHYKHDTDPKILSRADLFAHLRNLVDMYSKGEELNQIANILKRIINSAV